MPALIDLTNQTFGRWTALHQQQASAQGKTLWLCRCICGTERAVIGRNLKKGSSTSCGCIATEERERKLLTLGAATQGRSPAYTSWIGAKRRCEDPNDKSYDNYGGRGIKFLLPAYPIFWKKMGPTWFKGAQIDRKNNNGHYEMGNIRWTTAKVNSNNTRVNRNLTFQGKTMTASAWAEKLGIHKATLHWRLNAGWSVKDALTTKPKEKP